MAEPLLRVDAVSKRFGGLLAVDQASFMADAGRITALIGPNGAVSIMPAMISQASPLTASRGAGSRARSRSCSRSPG